MISVEKLWTRLSVITKTGTSGYFTDGDFNSNLYSVQYAILSLLCDNYENNQKVSDALKRHIVPLPGTTQANGKMFVTDLETNLPNYYRGLSLEFVANSKEYPSYKIDINEVSMYQTSAIRKPDITKNRTFWYMVSDNIQLLPKQALSYNFFYCKKPSEAKIAFTTAETDENDYLVVDPANSINIDFPEGLFNLFVYYMLEAIGIEQKENLAQSYSELGITRTTQTDLK